MSRFAAGWLHALATALVAVALLAGQAIPAAAVETTPGDAAGTAYTRESVRTMTWNMCGEAGGAVAGQAGYCPYRNTPQKKVDGIVKVIKEQNLNAVMLQEVCSVSHIGALDATLKNLADQGEAWAQGWTFALAGVTRPNEGDPEPERSGIELIDEEGSDCRGLSGTLGVAIGVRGQITWKSETDFSTPLNLSMNRGTVLCVEVAGWEQHLCTTHVSNFDGDVDATTAATYYNQQINTVAAVVKKFPSVVLGGDFNTSVQDKLQPLFSLMSECDQQAYYPGEASNETTKVTRIMQVNDGNPVGEPKDYAITSQTGFQTSKIDYLFSTDGFTGCDSWTGLADWTDYSIAKQPDCRLKPGDKTWEPQCAPATDAYSDHTPVFGRTQGGPQLSWKLDSAGGTAGGSGGHTGSPSGSVSWDADHGGSLKLNGSDTAVTAGGSVINTQRSFTVSAWAKVAAGADTSAVVSQDGQNISGMMLWFNKGDSTWRFGMPKTDSSGWSVDQAIAPATPEVWTHLTGVYDAAAGMITLYVNGAKKTFAAHTAPWSATGPFVVGRDKVNGANNAYFNGSIQRVEAFDYPMRDDQAASHAGKLTAPTGKSTEMQSTPFAALSQGCHLPVEAFGLDFGTATSLTPTLSATVAHPDPSAEVWAEFQVWDIADPTRQPIALGDSRSASAKVRGQGSVTVTVPTLTPGRSYGWRVRTNDGTSTSAFSADCRFSAPTSS
ncbi:LamG-like jellyroll fold domain-containing protein [Streptomyces sp. NPDC059875]|uniref:LamG-like jellyroll fold domain-containing protein n=1 Tax=unclassified Streptomyces TaxID=2593676 RepID=UPI003646A870